MRSGKPCYRYQPHPEQVDVCFWCGWPELDHSESLVIENHPEMELIYWEMLLDKPIQE